MLALWYIIGSYNLNMYPLPCSTSQLFEFSNSMGGHSWYECASLFVHISCPNILLIVVATVILAPLGNVDQLLWTLLGFKLTFPKAPLLHSSDCTYHPWKCLKLECDQCFMNKPSLLLCKCSGFTDPTVVMKWEKWDQMDYTRRNLIGGAPLPAEPLQELGIPLRYAPEAPKLQKTWVKKEGPIQDFFQILCYSARTTIHTYSAR